MQVSFTWPSPFLSLSSSPSCPFVIQITHSPSPFHHLPSLSQTPPWTSSLRTPLPFLLSSQDLPQNVRALFLKPRNPLQWWTLPRFQMEGKDPILRPPNETILLLITGMSPCLPLFLTFLLMLSPATEPPVAHPLIWVASRRNMMI